MTCTVLEIADGGLDYSRESLLPKDAGNDIADLYPPVVRVPYRPLLVDTGVSRVLLDTGAGPLAATTGRLLLSLHHAGIAPESIDAVILSHAHADHIGGLIDNTGRLSFPNARIILSQREHEFWRSSGIRARLGSGSVYGNAHLESVIGEWIDIYLLPLKERIEYVNDEIEIAPGIMVLPAPGHTPGHSAVLISSESGPLLYTADAFTLAAHIGNPEWTCAFDLDAPQTVATRKALLDRASFDGYRLIHYHIGEIGRVVRNGSRFRWDADPAN